MYAYALLNEDNCCHTVYECDIERNDFDCEYKSLDNYDLNYLNARWDNQLNEWEFPPGPGFIWRDGEWVNLNPPQEPQP